MTPALKKAYAEIERLKAENEAIKRELRNNGESFVALSKEVTKFAVQNRELLEANRKLFDEAMTNRRKRK